MTPFGLPHGLTRVPSCTLLIRSTSDGSLRSGGLSVRSDKSRRLWPSAWSVLWSPLSSGGVRGRSCPLPPPTHVQNVMRSFSGKAKSGSRMRIASPQTYSKALRCLTYESARRAPDLEPDLRAARRADVVALSMAERQAITKETAARYARATKRQRGLTLDELRALTGYSRGYGARAAVDDPRRPAAPRERPPAEREAPRQDARGHQESFLRRGNRRAADSRDVRSSDTRHADREAPRRPSGRHAPARGCGPLESRRLTTSQRAPHRHRRQNRRCASPRSVPPRATLPDSGGLAVNGAARHRTKVASPTEWWSCPAQPLRTGARPPRHRRVDGTVRSVRAPTRLLR